MSQEIIAKLHDLNPFLCILFALLFLFVELQERPSCRTRNIDDTKTPRTQVPPPSKALCRTSGLWRSILLVKKNTPAAKMDPFLAGPTALTETPRRTCREVRRGPVPCCKLTN
jgi:hypothetical protein